MNAAFLSRWLCPVALSFTNRFEVRGGSQRGGARAAFARGRSRRRGLVEKLGGNQPGVQTHVAGFQQLVGAQGGGVLADDLQPRVTQRSVRGQRERPDRNLCAAAFRVWANPQES